MHAVDWIVVAIYGLAMLALGLLFARRQHDAEDYYVAGRTLPWWAVGLSTMATQTSAISFLSVPAYVALAEGGGLNWLQYELAVPLAMIAVSMLLLPFFRHLQLISLYRYLEERFDARVRLLVSAVFLLSRGLATGVALYASALVLAVLLDAPLWATILFMGAFTVVYDLLGGIRAVVWSDVIQMAVLVLGIVVATGIALDLAGGTAAVFASVAPERLVALQPGHGIGDGSSGPFWGFLVGGFFLYMAYYGTDQSQAQRELSSAGVDHTVRSLALNGFARFPLTAGYAIMGLAIGAVVAGSPDLAAAIPAERPDAMVPEFLVRHMPVGLRGLLVAALLAAAMSSLDSALNALSAVTVRDYIGRRRELAPSRALVWGRVTTLGWGMAVTAFAFLVSSIPGTVIESINKIGSAFYGPVLAAFLVGVLSPRATSGGVLAGVALGVVTNIALWLAAPSVFWMWWNLSGLLVAATVVLAARGRETPAPERAALTLTGSGFYRERPVWRGLYTALFAWFVVLLGALAAVTRLACA